MVRGEFQAKIVVIPSGVDHMRMHREAESDERNQTGGQLQGSGVVFSWCM